MYRARTTTTLRARQGRVTGKIERTDRTNGATSLVLDRDYAMRVVELINRAEREIKLCIYAWRSYPESPESAIQKFNTALIRAHNRGVKIRCIVDGYNVKTQLERMGFEVCYIGRYKTMHTKALIVDDREMLMGSHNLTQRAFETNFESSLYITEHEPVLQFCEYFEQVWSGHVGR